MGRKMVENLGVKGRQEIKKTRGKGGQCIGNKKWSVVGKGGGVRVRGGKY